jgi:hypothetical protein
MLKSVYQAPNEFAAITIKEMLASQNIESVIRGNETTWLDGLPTVLKGYWCEVLVREEDAAEAEECIKEFLKHSAENPPEPDPGLDDDGVE